MVSTRRKRTRASADTSVEESTNTVEKKVKLEKEL